jgi:hypothetical protein
MTRSATTCAAVKHDRFVTVHILPKPGRLCKKVAGKSRGVRRTFAYAASLPRACRGEGRSLNAASGLFPKPSVVADEDPGAEGIKAVLPCGEDQRERHDLPPLCDHPFGRLPDVPLGVAVRPDAGEVV